MVPFAFVCVCFLSFFTTCDWASAGYGHQITSDPTGKLRQVPTGTHLWRRQVGLSFWDRIRRPGQTFFQLFLRGTPKKKEGRDAKPCIGGPGICASRRGHANAKRDGAPCTVVYFFFNLWGSHCRARTGRTWDQRPLPLGVHTWPCPKGSRARARSAGNRDAPFWLPWRTCADATHSRARAHSARSRGGPFWRPCASSHSPMHSRARAGSAGSPDGHPGRRRDTAEPGHRWPTPRANTAGN